MDFILTLVAGPDKNAPLTDAIVAVARDALNSFDVETTAPDWLAPDKACDVFVSGTSPKTVEQTVRTALRAYPVDIAVGPALGRKKKLLVADMDATIVVNETLDEIADHVGLKAEVAAITAQAMRGEIEYHESLRRRVALLKDLPETALAETYARTVVSPGAEALVRTMRAWGAVTALVSSGFDYFTGRVRERVGFEFDFGNEFVIENGRLAGRVVEPIFDRFSKLETLKILAEKFAVAQPMTLAIGDGANDLEMVKWAGLGVAYHAKPVLADAANARIDHGDLTTLLYMQGYREAEIVRR